MTPPSEQSREAAKAIWIDLLDRRGIKWECEKVDDDVVQEIEDAHTEIIAAALSAAPAPGAPADDAETVVLDWARAAGPTLATIPPTLIDLQERIETFAASIRADERRKCADACRTIMENATTWVMYQKGARACLRAIEQQGGASDV